MSTIQERQDFINEINQDQVTQEEANQLRNELGKDLAIAEAAPKAVNEIAAAIERAKQFVKDNPDALNRTARTFNQASYDENDAKAKAIFSTYIKSKGHIISSNEENYGIDIITSKNKKEFKFELEISSINFTNENDFPYDNIHFLGRKKKMMDRQGNYFYIIISTNLEYAVMAQAKYIFKQENYITKYAGNGRDGVDEFYQLPKNQVKFFKIGLTNE
jgi:hypothetical protein